MPGQEYYQSQFTGQQIDQKLNSIPTKVSDLTNDSGFIANTVNNLVNYYLKSDTYSKSEVDSIINTIKNGRFQNVNSLPEEDIDTNVIYLVQKQNTENNNIKDEYINLDGTSTGWEKIGSTEINLDGYVTIQALNTALSNYVQSSNIVTILANRTSFSSVENMVATPSADLYDGCLAYVTATKKNYQYDSSNEADPTLGKWRELQTGGGGGTDYTAGDGIDITEDVISTKQSEEGDIDEIIDVYPQAGNLVSIVNAFNRGDIYSTDEKMIGQWTDGKPLYQKSFEFPSTVTITKGSWRDSGVAIQNAEQVLNAFVITNQYHLCAPIQACVSTTLIPSGNIGLYSGKDDDMLMDSLTIQYTKTTDTAISIGSETEYSTDEKVVGTWIDGKPVYQKTFANLTLAKQSATTLIENVDTCVECQTSYIRGGVRLMGSFYFSSSDFVNMFGAVNAEHNFYIYYDYNWYDTPNAISNINVIVRYTKTT